jgi:hypothetical protein
MDRLAAATNPAGTDSGKGKGKGRAAIARQEDDTSPDRVHRLHLTLISTLSALPLRLLGKALEEAYKAIVAVEPTTASRSIESTPTLPLSATTTTRKRELVEALFREILEGVGDREKEFAMSWWYEHRHALLAVAGGIEGSHYDGEVEEAKAVTEDEVASSSNRARL